ncbi:MAG TPA: class I tRNA ligase family protein [Solirubrobacteraceae bacterium]|nr:class I tRNA ligase family protein [Solirubrobacteraceae bacterium]
MNDQTLPRYEPLQVEARRQQRWRERDVFRTPAVDGDRGHLYIKPSAPFTSGNIHIGHVRSYSIGDAYARFRRARGDDVLFAFGFDAFGLPAELGAIAAGIPPQEWVSRCAEHMTGQLLRLGFSLDWERTFMSSDALMYRWSQWLFLTLLERGLIYRGTSSVDWCENCQTTLASIQVEAGGTCWRCHGPVRLVEMPQWYLRISEYVAENDARLAELRDSAIWDDVALSSQEFVLGRADGVEFGLTGDGGPLLVFTPHVDALGAAAFVMLSPRHPDAEAWAKDAAVVEQLETVRAGGWERSEREAETVPVIDTRSTIVGPAGTPLPVLISPIVDSRFGVTAVLGVPAADRSDEVIAGRMGLAAPAESAAVQIDTRAAQRYKAFDFTISRQRSWGTPIPIVYCESCGTVPLAKSDLPVELPLDLIPTGEGNPLAERENFVNAACPACGGPARRETDTLDCHFDALWLWLPACVPGGERERSLEEILALEDLRHWLPSERLVAGSDSGNFVFDQRIVTKALRDIGPLAFMQDGEPFAGCLFHEMVIRDGRKMSKHLGNVVDPDELVDRYGADTVRLALLFAAKPQRTLNWSDSAVLRCHRFLNQVWDYVQSRAALEAAPADDGERDMTEHLRVRLIKWCEAGVEKITEDMVELEMHSATRNVMRLFDRIRDFEKRVLAKESALSQANLTALIQALTVFVQTLAPLAPHIAEELFELLGGDANVDFTPWPSVSFTLSA